MKTQRNDYRFFHRLRVRWAEVDMQRIVFNAHYLMYFDTAMADYWRALALPYEAALKQLDGDLYVKKASVEYHASARYDDVLDVGLRCARVGTSSVVFEGGVFCGEKLLVSGELIYVFANPLTQVSRPIAQPLRDVFTDYEAKRSMVDVQVGNWQDLGPQASALREEVFVQEQGIGAHMVWDDADASAVHAVLLNKLGMPVATGRLLACAAHGSRIGRVAVKQVLRGSSLGREVMMALMAASRARGDTEVMLHAQCSAAAFYRKLGFVERGEVFQEAGIDHVEMAMALKSEAH